MRHRYVALRLVGMAVMGMKKEGVCALAFGDATAWEALGEVSNLFSAAVFPALAIRALEERLVLTVNTFTRVHMDCSMHDMHGVIADGSGVSRAGGNEGRFDAFMLLGRGSAAAAAAAAAVGARAGSVGRCHNSRW
jgi:hypothetical protein